jgi:hypothetical protein
VLGIEQRQQLLQVFLPNDHTNPGSETQEEWKRMGVDVYTLWLIDNACLCLFVQAMFLLRETNDAGGAGASSLLPKIRFGVQQKEMQRHGEKD